MKFEIPFRRNKRVNPFFHILFFTQSSLNLFFPVLEDKKNWFSISLTSSDHWNVCFALRWKIKYESKRICLSMTNNARFIKWEILKGFERKKIQSRINILSVCPVVVEAHRSSAQSLFHRKSNENNSLRCILMHRAGVNVNENWDEEMEGDEREQNRDNFFLGWFWIFFFFSFSFSLLRQQQKIPPAKHRKNNIQKR